jgi:hypothetical protein
MPAQHAEGSRRIVRVVLQVLRDDQAALRAAAVAW